MRYICDYCGAVRDGPLGPTVEVSEAEKVALRLNETHVSRCILHSMPFTIHAELVEIRTKANLVSHALTDCSVTFGYVGDKV
jgi:hypothetical protein